MIVFLISQVVLIIGRVRPEELEIFIEVSSDARTLGTKSRNLPQSRQGKLQPRNQNLEVEFHFFFGIHVTPGGVFIYTLAENESEAH